MNRLFFVIGISVVATLGTSGCVDRFLLVRSDPPGARVYIDAQAVGTTPVKVPFEHYGSREVLLRHSAQQDGRNVHYKSVAQIVDVKSPWYQWFPLDLAAEFLWPGTITDTHEVTVHLTPQDPEALRAALDEAAERLGAPAADATSDTNAEDGA
ncbi:MAG: PEGA domain-containing protein [Planctomycetota bacterium]